MRVFIGFPFSVFSCLVFQCLSFFGFSVFCLSVFRFSFFDFQCFWFSVFLHFLFCIFRSIHYLSVSYLFFLLFVFSFIIFDFSFSFYDISTFAFYFSRFHFFDFRVFWVNFFHIQFMCDFSALNERISLETKPWGPKKSLEIQAGSAFHGSFRSVSGGFPVTLFFSRPHPRLLRCFNRAITVPRRLLANGYHNCEPRSPKFSLSDFPYLFCHHRGARRC